MYVQPRQGIANFSCQAVEFSPFHEHWLAVATAQYFGIIGNGQQLVMELLASGELKPLRAFDTQDGIYDVAWSETHANQLVSGCANGHLKLWDVTTPDDFPIQTYAEHSMEVSSVNWNMMDRQHFVSGSWDTTLKLWTPVRPQSVLTLSGHTGPIYNAIWSAHSNNL
ncbi:peroxisomal targeting signal 2 receptor, partial [Thraustotheca clavata]